MTENKDEQIKFLQATVKALADRNESLEKLTPSQKLIDYSKKIIKIREILEKPQYMDEAVLLKIKILEVLDS